VHEEALVVAAGSVVEVVGVVGGVVVVVVLFSAETPSRVVQAVVIQVQASLHRLCCAAGIGAAGVFNKLAAWEVPVSARAAVKATATILRRLTI
jgi:hypothetical protein